MFQQAYIATDCRVHSSREEDDTSVRAVRPVWEGSALHSEGTQPV